MGEIFSFMNILYVGEGYLVGEGIRLPWDVPQPELLGPKKALWITKSHSSNSCQHCAVEATTEEIGAEGAASTQAQVSTSVSA